MQKEQANADALKAALNAPLTSLEAAIDKLKGDTSFIDNSITNSSSSQPPASFNLPTNWLWPSGTCKPFPIIFSVSGYSAHADDKGQFCKYYDEVFHPLIY